MLLVSALITQDDNWHAFSAICISLKTPPREERRDHHDSDVAGGGQVVSPEVVQIHDTAHHLIETVTRLWKTYIHPPRGQSSLPCWASLLHFSFSDVCEYKNCPKRWNRMATRTNRDSVCSGTRKICGLKLTRETYLIVSRQDSHFRSKYRYHMFPHTSTAFSHCYYCKRLLPEMASCWSEVREECCVRDEMNPTSNMLSKSTCIVRHWRRLPREAVGLIKSCTDVLQAWSPCA